MAICGHVHEGRGAERVLWDLYNPNIKYKEQATGYWTDPGLGVGNRQQSFLDLSSTGPAPLDNGGYLATKAEGIQFEKAAELPPGIQRQPWTSMESFASTSVSSKSAASTFEGSFDGSPSPALEEDYPAVRGQGGGPPSGRCDMEALNGRMGRRETCIINASIMASSWPYKTEGGLKYNKPIVFDIDLPVWRDPNEI